MKSARRENRASASTRRRVDAIVAQMRARDRAAHRTRIASLVMPLPQMRGKDGAM